MKTLWERKKKFFLIYGGICCGVFLLMLLAVLFMDWATVVLFGGYTLFDIISLIDYFQLVYCLGALFILVSPAGLLLIWKCLVDDTWSKKMPLLWGVVGGNFGTFLLGILILSFDLEEGAAFSSGYYMTVIFGAVGVFGAFFLMGMLSYLKSGKYEEEEIFKWSFFFIAFVMGFTSIAGGPKKKKDGSADNKQWEEALERLEHLRESGVLSEAEYAEKRKKLEEQRNASERRKSAEVMIKELEELRTQGLLSDEEFEEKRRQLMGDVEQQNFDSKDRNDNDNL